ncbi:unnamed protein product [Camellia sinensis]
MIGFRAPRLVMATPFHLPVTAAQVGTFTVRPALCFVLMGTQERQPRQCWSCIGNWKLILNSYHDIFEERTELLQLYDLVEHKVQGDGNCQASWQGIEVAVKKLGEEVTADEDKMAFSDELELLQKIRHPNVVQFLGAVTRNTPMMIVTEYLPKRFGTLLMRKVKRCFTCYKPTDHGNGEKSPKNCNYYSEMSAEEKNEKITSAISYCEVANFEYIDEVEAAAEEEARKASTENKTTTNNPDRAIYWEELLKDRYEVHKVEDFNAMGKGNRRRKQMVSVEDEDLAGLEDVRSEGEDDNYEAELTDEETAASGILTGRRPYRKKICVDSAESLPLMEGEGRSFRVKGFNQNQRAAFVQIMMRFGVREFDWAEYGTLFLTHIAEDITDSPTFSDGVPKGLRIEDVLVRIAVLLLIRDKVKAASEKPGTPLFPDDIVSRFPGLKRGRHGYGRWQAIVDDKDLKVQEVICQELNLPVVTLPVPGASQSQDGANVVSAETPMNETKGTVVGNDLAVDAANRAPDAANRSQLFQDSSSLYHYREMQRRQIEFIKKKGDAKANETRIEEPETEAKVLDMPSPCSMEIDSQTNNQLPQVITSEEISAAACDDKPDRLEIARLYNEKLDVNEPACEQMEPSTTGHWEEKELVSRDGQAKLKANVFFASFDQHSDKAVGESACAALAAVIASWLQSNQDNMPTRAQFDKLIVEGSSEWRKLCDNQDLINQFPNKHFDIETVLQARLRPILVLHVKSFIGFFAPEKFETLKGVMSFDQIWDEIKKNAEGDNDMPRIYIVSWNDHFFVLKVDVNAYYIINTFGERLFEGCNQAYILRFDDSALMRGKIEKEGVSSNQTSGDEICSGKECCREFMKRFLAAIPLRELELEEKMEPVAYFALHQ